MNTININLDGFHDEWNYTISPTLAESDGTTGAAINLGVD
jgi:hypothetical protein